MPSCLLRYCCLRCISFGGHYTMALTKKQQQALVTAADRVRGWLTNRLDADAVEIATLYRSSRDILIARLRNVYETFLGDDPTFVRARISGAGRALDQAIDQQINQLAQDLSY